MVGNPNVRNNAHQKKKKKGRQNTRYWWEKIMLNLFRQVQLFFVYSLFMITNPISKHFLHLSQPLLPLTTQCLSLLAISESSFHVFLSSFPTLRLWKTAILNCLQSLTLSEIYTQPTSKSLDVAKYSKHKVKGFGRDLKESLNCTLS